MSSFNDYITEPIKDGINRPGGLPLSQRIEKYARVVNDFDKGKFVAIGGKPTSGKRSMMDQHYFIEMFQWWYHLEEQRRPKLKMFYFSMKTKPKVKFQKWLCLFLKLEHNMVVDIPTLNNSKGKLFDLDENDLSLINEAQDFFDELENECTILSGPKTGSAIMQTIDTYMDSIGTEDDNDEYHLDDAHKGQFTIVYIDDAEEILPEPGGFHDLNPEGIKRKMYEHIHKITRHYNISVVMVCPSKVSSSRVVKDSEPSYKELGYYGKKCDVGVIMYNPYNENNNKYLSYPIEETIINNKTRFRTITIVRNYNGIDNVTIGAFFLGECGYLTQSPGPLEFEQFQDALNNLKTLN